MKSPEEKIANELTKMNRALTDISNKLTKIANASVFANCSSMMWTRMPDLRDKPTDDSRNEQPL